MSPPIHESTIDDAPRPKVKKVTPVERDEENFDRILEESLLEVERDEDDALEVNPRKITI